MMKNKYYLLIMYYLSIFIRMTGMIQLLPLLCLPFYPEEVKWAPCFLFAGIGAIVLGFISGRILKGAEIVKLEKHYDAVLVVLVWISAIFISTIPWMLKGDYNFTQAAFEMTSGFSTTGLSVVDVDHTPHIFLLFRSITLFVGGVGLVLILTSVFSDKYGLDLYHAEGHTDRLMPNLAKSARLILSIYSGFILFGTIAYMFFGMPLFDAVNTSIAAVSTGGFSVIGESIYGYHSLGVEIVSIVLMLLGQTNFLIHLSILRKKYRNFFRHCETRFLWTLGIMIIPLMAFNLVRFDFSNNFFEALRVAVFHFVTTITTTGFVAVKDMSLLPNGFVTFMVLLMLIGGNLESTGGGLKQYRVIVTVKGIIAAIKNTVASKNTVSTVFVDRVGRKSELTKEEIGNTSSYVLFYLILFFAGSLIFTLYGYSLQDSMFEFSSAISTVGLSLGITSYSASPVILWTATVGMFLGRLEIMVVFEAILRGIKDIRNKES